MRNVIVLTLLSGALIGCAAKSGHQFLEKTTNTQLAAQIIKGQTTKDQVRKMYGNPTDIEPKENGTESWKYEFIRSVPKASSFIPIVQIFESGSDDNIKRLRILFSNQGVVESFAFTSSEGETKSGIFH